MSSPYLSYSNFISIFLNFVTKASVFLFMVYKSYESNSSKYSPLLDAYSVFIVCGPYTRIFVL